jgi:hypothetical protein
MILAYVADIIQKCLMEQLHGSGWDTDWVVGLFGKGFKCEIDYHHMNDHGYYDGYSKINVYINYSFDIERITFTTTDRLRRKYLWDRDYFETEIHQAMGRVKFNVLNLLEV